MQPVEPAIIADVTDPRADHSRLPHGVNGSTLESDDGLDLVVVRSVQNFDNFKSFSLSLPYSRLHRILLLQWVSLFTLPATSGICRRSAWTVRHPAAPKAIPA